MSSTGDLVLRGAVVGVLAAYLVFYGLRPGAAYPKWMLGTYDQPWLLLVLLAVIVWITQWDLFAGILATLGFVAFIADLYVFGRATGGDDGTDSEAGSSDAGSGIGSDDGAPIGVFGADAGSALSRIVVAPGIEPAYSLYPVFEDANGERLGGPAPF